MPTVDRSAPLHDVRGGFLGMLGAQVVEAGPERAVVALDVGPQHAQPHGVLHGGVHATLVESAASVGGHMWMAERGGTVVGVTNTTHFFRPFTAGRITATATPVHQGRSQQLWQVDITDEAGKLISRGEVRLHNMTLET
ncbi:MAG: PaaI family thioesterase [Sporichthyaceae bacterium]